MDVCRTCLTLAIEKDIAQLPTGLEDAKESPAEIMLFCLNIKVLPESKLSTKLCITCYLNILAFYKFKKIAAKCEKYLRSIKVDDTSEETGYDIFIKEDIKNEIVTYDDMNDNHSDIDFKIDYEFKLEKNEEESQSGDELLCNMKKIKDENTNEKKVNMHPPKKEKRKKEKREKKEKGCKEKRKRNREMERRAEVCEECGKLVKNIKDHLHLHKPKEDRRRFKCKACDKTFASPSAACRHYKIKHLGIKEHCNLCNKDVTTLANHIKLVHNTSLLKFECLECGQRLISKSALEVHMLRHTKGRPHECNQCDKAFLSKTQMRLHIRSVHDKERHYVCHYCSKSFFKKHQLILHIRTHSKERPHACPECGKCFTTTSILSNHRRTHSDLKPYSCDQCDMKFSRLGYLRNHTISHTKEKRYPCQYCGVRFGRSDHRKRHERTAHEKHYIQAKNNVR